MGLRVSRFEITDLEKDQSSLRPLRFVTANIGSTYI